MPLWDTSEYRGYILVQRNENGAVEIIQRNEYIETVADFETARSVVDAYYASAK